MVGVFAATDVFLFYVFFEAMLVPMYFLIGSFGGPRRQYAAVKFFLYSLVGGLIMLAAVIGLYVVSATRLGQGTLRLDDAAAHGRAAPASVQKLLFLGFFVAFAIKAPLVPFHTWLPDAGAEAPIGGGVLLRRRAGQGRHLRLPALLPAAVPRRLALPRAAASWCSRSSASSTAALLAMGQSDMKRLVAYTSISHFGFIALGHLRVHPAGGHRRGALHGQPRHLDRRCCSSSSACSIARGGSRQIADYGGVGRIAPLLAGLFLHRRSGLARAAGHQQLRQRVPGADRLVPARAGVHDHRDRRHRSWPRSTCC